MKIVIDGRIIRSSTGRYVERLLTYLQKIDKQNEYVVIVKSADVDYWQPSSKNFSVVACDAADFSLAEQTKLLKQLNNLHADVVHFCMPQQPVLYRGKKITTVHDLFQLKASNPTKNQIIYRFKQLVGWFVFKHVLRSNNHIITDSNYSKRDIERFSSSAIGKTITVYLSADKLTAKQPVKYAKLPLDNYLLYVGQQSEHKNIRRLVRAHQLLLEKYPDLWLVLVGKVNDIAKLNQKWVEENNYKNVHFTGFVADEELAWLYENATCYTFASLMEGFGLPGLEAMQYGTPVASSNTTCLPEIYGEAAEYFDPTSVDDMAQTIERVIEDESLRKELVENGYRQLKKYSWEKMARETHAIYMSVLSKD